MAVIDHIRGLPDSAVAFDDYDEVTGVLDRLARFRGELVLVSTRRIADVARHDGLQVSEREVAGLHRRRQQFPIVLFNCLPSTQWRMTGWHLDGIFTIRCGNGCGIAC